MAEICSCGTCHRPGRHCDHALSRCEEPAAYAMTFRPARHPPVVAYFCAKHTAEQRQSVERQRQRWSQGRVEGTAWWAPYELHTYRPGMDDVAQSP